MSRRCKLRALPPGAVTFHLSVWPRGVVDEAGAAEARGLIERYRLERLHVGHGNALLAGNRVVLLIGPPGVGKSSAAARVESEGLATAIEDGLVLVGERPGGWVLIETGALQLLATASRLSRWMRRVLGLYDSIYYYPDGHLARRRRALHRYLVELPSFYAAVLLTRSRAAPSQTPRPVHAAVVLSHPHGPPDWFGIDAGGAVEPVTDLRSVAPEYVELTTLSTIGERDEVRERILGALRTAASH